MSRQATADAGALGGGNIDETAWRRSTMIREVVGGPVPQLCDHSCVVHEETKTMLVFGGLLPSLGRLSDDVYEYRLDTKAWALAAVNGKRPAARGCHTAILFGNQMLVFGGWDGKSQLNDLWVYSLATKTWSSIEPTEGFAPSARQNHAAVKAVDDKMLIHGGFNGTERLGDLHEFSFSTKSWRQVACEGLLPAPRDGHTLTSIGGMIYLFGGYTVARTNDLFVYNPTTSTWTRLAPSPGVPGVRFAHTALAIGTSLYVFHGFDGNGESSAVFEYDTVGNKWKTSVDFSGDALEGHSYHATAALETEKKVICIGGWNGTKYLTTVYEYDFTEPSEKETKPGKKK